jgi:hypothetical protein
MRTSHEVDHTGDKEDVTQCVSDLESIPIIDKYLVRLADKSWLKVLFADLLLEKNTAEWLADLADLLCEKNVTCSNLYFVLK